MFVIDALMPWLTERSLKIGPTVFRCTAVWLLAGLMGVAADAQTSINLQNTRLPARTVAAQRFLAGRSLSAGAATDLRLQQPAKDAVTPLVQTTTATSWSALGPGSILTAHYGAVSGRVTSIALDPADTTGNHLYIGTTGGGVWMAQNAASTLASQVVLQPLTDGLSALNGAWNASISVGAVTVQPASTGVILVGTGDPNDALDSYYGAGILRSTDGGSTWSLISRTSDLASGLSTQNFGFAGEGFAGFAWSGVNAQIVVAAVSQAYEGTLVNAVLPSYSAQGLYYSSDSGATWHFATITDGGGSDVQGPLDKFPSPDGNAATAVVWNPVRKVFIAAVRYHGYYQSADGVTWTRLAAQPGTGLTMAMCPTNPGMTGSIACPIFRGALAVNPVTGDTFAWTVDANSQDQGLWQDQCALSGGVCTNSSIAFQQQWGTAALESSTSLGRATIADGVYNLALAAIPQQQATMVLAGANDLWQSSCPVSLGCTWRNTTNAGTCTSAQVGPFQHALEWNHGNSQEIFVGNDSGIWRSTDQIAETGSPCNSSDATHFQNLNAQLENKDGSAGSLAETESLSPVFNTPYTLMAGMGVNGAAGVKSSSVSAQWPQMLGGYGGPVAIDPANNSNWYVNDQAGVAIYRCSQASACTAANFGSAPAVSDADVNGDGYVMPLPAQFLVDPLDTTQLLVGTCRIWRGAAAGGWNASNAVSPILDTGQTAGVCAGDALIRSMAAAATSSSTEVIYAGMYGAANGGANLAGHVLTATLDAKSGSMPVWHDLSFDAVGNDARRLNYYGYDISSVVIDPQNTKTIYVTVEGEASTTESVQTVYRSTDGGATWNSIVSNLPSAPASALVVDPQNSSTVYVATDQGVYYTSQIASCTTAQSNCWSAFGSGLPQSPVVALSAAPQSASAQVLVAATYGRGIWQTPLASAGTSITTATVSPASMTFADQTVGTTSAALRVTLTNTGTVPLEPSSIAINGNVQDFGATGCTGQTIAAGASCTIQVTFSPQATGVRSAVMTVSANISGGQLTVNLSGNGLVAWNVSLTPGSLNFGQVKVGATSATQPAQLQNVSASAVAITGASVTAPFVLSSNSCGASLATNSSCQMTVAFAPTQSGASTGQLTVTDSAGTQTVQLTGTGAAPATDSLSPAALTFVATSTGQISTAQTVTITNSGDVALHIASIASSANFQQSSSCLSGVAAHSSCAVSVTFAPTQAGALTGLLTITDDLGTETVSLNGMGLAPGAMSVSPTSVSFAQQQPGVASTPQTVIVTNTGGAAIANISFQVTGAAAASYSVSATTCGASLAGGAQCTAQIVFTPSGTGVIAATLAVSSSTAGVTAAQVQLNGAGQLAAGLTTTPGLLGFATAIAVGQASSTQTVTITNASGYAIPAVALAATGPFSLTANTCSGSLAAGSACTTGIIFQPTGTGTAAGMLTVTSTVVTAPATVALSGTGFDFGVQTSGSSSATVSNGQQADYKLVVTPSGAQGTFSFQCDTLPANAQCVFSPGTATLAAGTQGNVEVQIYTGNSVIKASAETGAPSRSWPLAFALVLLPVALRRGRRVLLLVVLAACLIPGITSCASSLGGTGGTSSSNSQNSSSSTPTGTYSVPVSVKSCGISRSVTLTLTVD
jgi:hypothetical protein